MSRKRCVEDAIALAVSFHDGQTDKAGDPYILHLCRVMVQFDDPIRQMVAVLHDIIEDTDCSLELLTVVGYPEEVTQAIDCLTRKQDEIYETYIERCRGNEIARQVKRADLVDHLNRARQANLKARLIQRYTKAYHQLNQ